MRCVAAVLVLVALAAAPEQARADVDLRQTMRLPTTFAPPDARVDVRMTWETLTIHVYPTLLRVHARFGLTGERGGIAAARRLPGRPLLSGP